MGKHQACSQIKQISILYIFCLRSVLFHSILFAHLYPSTDSFVFILIAHTQILLGILYSFLLCVMWIHCFDHFTGWFCAFFSHHIFIPTQISTNISIELAFYFINSLCVCLSLSLRPWMVFLHLSLNIESQSTIYV